MRVKGKWRGDRARGARERSELAPTRIAAEVGVTTETLRSWERGDTLPDAQQLCDLAAALGVDLIYLVNLTDTPVAV